ncbi:Small conductance calcium-activated potassium channel protein 1 [Fasciola gigantica]|uniref:Small conductance calcium-activated potassium channel protein 1 n=1 Tax=Fasciola gigantica TaxID=46835 RepID=A0A504ZCP4_FASGI|nr:Small conductance calcium-activated potassium channel protein 1 [Fasciola gigantica]
MNVIYLLNILITMSGLPKRKYQRLDSPPSMQMTELSEQMLEKETARDNTNVNRIECPQTAENTAEGNEEHELETAVAKKARQSIEQIFSGNSLFEQESESVEHIASQFQEIFHRMSSSQSESWFTASSLTDEVGGNTSDVLTQTESFGAVSQSNQQNRSSVILNKDPTDSLTMGISSTSFFQFGRPKPKHGHIGNEIEVPGPPGRSFVLKPHTRSSVRSSKHSTTKPQTENPDFTSVISASPTKMLRTKWKRLFNPRSPLPSSKSQMFHSKSHQIQRSLSHHSTIIEVSSEPLSYACMPRNIVLIKEKENLASQLKRPSRSMYGDSGRTRTEDTQTCAEQKVPNQKQSDDLGVYDGAHLSKCFPVDEVPKTPIGSTKPNRSGTKISLLSSHSVVSVESRTEFHRYDGYKLAQKNQIIHQKPSDTTDANSNQDPAWSMNDAEHFDAPSVPEEFKTSFEREQDDPENLLVREAHVGALALAWASGTRKTRHKIEHSQSERQSSSASPPRITKSLGLNSQRRKYESEYLESQGDSMRILAKFHKENEKGQNVRSILKQHSEDDQPGEAHMIGSVVKGPTKTALMPLRIKTPKYIYHNTPTIKLEPIVKRKTDSLSVSPTKQESEDVQSSASDKKTQRSTTGTVQNKLFKKKRTGSKRALNVSHSDEEEGVDSESITLELGSDGLPVGQRAQIRRGGQDIPPLCSSGGPLGATQQPLLQKSQPRGIGWRLSQRKLLNEQRRKIADYSFLLAVIGILLMVLELEFLMARLYTRDATYNLKVIHLSFRYTFILDTVVEISSLFQVTLFSVNNCIEDWRIATNPRKMGFVVLEVLLCMIHPAPILSNYTWPGERSHLLFLSDHPTHPDVTFPPSRHTTSGTKTDETSGKPSAHILDMYNSSTLYVTAPTAPWSVPQTTHGFEEHKSEFISLELSLSIPMFLRLYLIFRVLLLHSTFFTDAGSQSIGALNRVKINVRFVLKTLATAKPGTMLLIFILSMWVITSWIMRVCERQQNPEYERMFNTMWLIAVTFLSIGYGDMVPSTHCGRSVSVIAGVMGSACTALVVAVVARKLELSRAEKHVHNFMQDNKVYKQLRHSAANVLRETWLFYKHTRLVKRVNAARVRRHQRKFLQAISRLRKAKDNQRKLKEDANSMVDVVKLQTSIQESVTHIRSDRLFSPTFLLSVERLIQLQMQISQLPDTLNLLLECGQSAQPEAGLDNVDEYSPTGVAFTLDG